MDLKPYSKFAALLLGSLLAGGCQIYTTVFPSHLAKQTTLTNKIATRQVPTLAETKEKNDYFLAPRIETPVTFIATTYLELASYPTLPCIDLPEAELLEDKSQEEALRARIIDFAENFLGWRYRQNGLDCSGFTSHVLAKFGIKVSRSSSAQAKQGILIPLEEAKEGDLLFFGYKNGKIHRVSHAAMVYSNEEGNLKMIHSCSRGILIDSLDSPAWRNYYAKRFLFAKRVITDENTQEQEEMIIEHGDGENY
jgi:hypothetical protein